MYHIDIIGMKKKRDLKIVYSIIIISIILAICCIGYILYNEKTTKLASNSNVITEEQTENIISEEQKNTAENVVTQKSEEEINAEKEFINQINNIYNGEEGKRVFLTFDDGPSETVTPKILEILDKYNIKATFFVVGYNVKAHPEIVKQAYEAGHYIANHGYSNKYSKIYESADTVLQEYNKTESAIREALEDVTYSSHLFRFPGGAHGGPYEEIKEKARKKLNEEGVAYLDWSALTYDAAGADTKEEILCNLKETMNGWDNVVILMHDAPDKKVTYETLEDVIEYLQEKGYEFKNIYDLM